MKDIIGGRHINIQHPQQPCLKDLAITHFFLIASAVLFTYSEFICVKTNTSVKQWVSEAQQMEVTSRQ